MRSANGEAGRFITDLPKVLKTFLGLPTFCLIVPGTGSSLARTMVAAGGGSQRECLRLR